MKKLTIEEFIEKAKKIHGDKYDYSKVEYKNSQTKVTIICPEHGEFLLKPNTHINSKTGCSKCFGNHQYSTEEFIEKANKIHNNKYDYLKAIYSKAHNKICIICPKHGEFWQRAYAHLQGAGCSKCSKKYHYTTEEFINKAKEIHGDKYNYNKTEYTNSGTKVCIICPKHGEFWQTAVSHTRSKYGCPNCNESKGEKEINKILTENNIKFETQKIFKSCKNKLPLPFDFWLPEHNMVIEYDGIQHFEPMRFSNGKENFKKTKINDKIKNKWAKENNISLLRISYIEFNNIKNILNYTFIFPE